jgi:hypothetical protein
MSCQRSHCSNFHDEKERQKDLSSDFLIVPKCRQVHYKTNNYAKFAKSDTDEIWQNRLPHTKINKKDLATSQQVPATEEKMLSVGASCFTPGQQNFINPQF